MARFPTEPALLRKIAGQVDRLQTLAGYSAKYAFPARGRIQSRLFHDVVHTYLLRLGSLLKFKPKEAVGRQSKPVGLALDSWEFNIPEHLDGNRTLCFRQIEVNRLRKTRKICDA